MHTINLCALPNLFVSFSDDQNLPTIFQSFLRQLSDNNTGIILALSFGSILSKQLEAFTEQALIFIAYNHNGDEKSEIRNIDEFIQQLLAEMKNRMALLKKKALLSLQPMVILMDDIFEVLRSHNRKTINAFIALLRKGSFAKMYFVIGSSGIYRNLLQQIINDLTGNSKNNNKNVATKEAHGLGAELVINFDGLIFYKETGEGSYRKFYPLEKTNL